MGVSEGPQCWGAAILGGMSMRNPSAGGVLVGGSKCRDAPPCRSSFFGGGLLTRSAGGGAGGAAGVFWGGGQ